MTLSTLPSLMSGPFWLSCTYTYTETGQLCCDFSEAHMIARPLSEIFERTPSHKESWPLVAGAEKNKLWNYYPRGRVEVRNHKGKNKVLVFLNPLCLGYENLEAELRKQFCIPQEVTIDFKADNSPHYEITSV